MSKRFSEPDIVGAGFHRLDRKLEDRPPKINWGPLYRGMGSDDKLSYLEKLAAAMNHAAHLVQEERNQWAKLAADKEQKVIQSQKAINDNNAMIQSEIAKMNDERQHYFAEIKELRAQLRAVKKEITNGSDS